MTGPVGAADLRGERMEAGLRTLELDVRHRLDGLLQGNHLGLVPGPGSEPGEARQYQPGDDVRRIDWAVTARTTTPHIRETVADRELETWVVADLSPSLDFGTAACEKRDLVVCAVAAIAHLTRGGATVSGRYCPTGPRPCGSHPGVVGGMPVSWCVGSRRCPGLRRAPAATSPRSWTSCADRPADGALRW